MGSFRQKFGNRKLLPVEISEYRAGYAQAQTQRIAWVGREIVDYG